MNSKLTILAPVVMTLAGVASNPQVGEQMRHIKSATGLLVVSDVEGNYFRMQIKGKDAARLHPTKRYWYTTEGVKFEFYSEENAKFFMADAPNLEDGVVLRLYRSDFIRRFAGDNPKVRSAWLKLANNKQALLLTYENHPAGPLQITERQIYIAIAGATHVFGLFAPVLAGQNERHIRHVLVRTLGSLSFNGELLDIYK